MAWVGSTGQSKMSLFLEYVPEKKNMAEAVTRDMSFSDWLKLKALCLFRAQSAS